MPKFRIVSVKVETVVFDTDKCDKHDQYLIDDMGAQQYAEVTISENEFSMDIDENPCLVSFDVDFFGNTEEVE